MKALFAVFLLSIATTLTPKIHRAISKTKYGGPEED